MLTFNAETKEYVLTHTDGSEHIVACYSPNTMTSFRGAGITRVLGYMYSSDSLVCLFSRAIEFLQDFKNDPDNDDLIVNANYGIEILENALQEAYEWEAEDDYDEADLTA